MTAAVIPLPPFRRGEAVLIDGETPALFEKLISPSDGSEPIAMTTDDAAAISDWRPAFRFVRLSRVRRV